jgi:ubiquitin carboxyl-terminal hydrolase 25/28
MRSTPYYLYSILIHEGSADSGHYYSYTYDIQSKTWRKYNDINITEEV